MSSCELCGKEFKFPYLLLRHLNKKNPCSPNKFSNLSIKNHCQEVKEDCSSIKGNCQNIKNHCQEVKNKQFECTLCQKELTSKRNLDNHMKICKGVDSFTCPVCKVSFNSRQAKGYHIKNVKCSPPENKQLDMAKEILALKKENAILKASKQNTNITNNNNTNINNNYTIKYVLKYNPETKCLTTDDPDAPIPELLCFNGFKLEAARSKLKDIDQETLQMHIDNVRLKKDFYSLYTFFFRNVDNRRLHMFNLGKNNNTTHAQVFNNGAIEKMEKSQLFENVSKYIGQYLLNMSIENADVIYALTTDQASKTAFIEVTRDRSCTFDYFKKAPEIQC